MSGGLNDESWSCKNRRNSFPGQANSRGEGPGPGCARSTRGPEEAGVAGRAERGERGVGRGQRDRRGQGLWASGDQGLEFSFSSKCKGRPLIWVLRRSLWLPCVSKIHSLKRRFPCLSAQGRLQDTVLGLLPGSRGHEKRHAFNVASSAFTDVPPLLCKAFLSK